MAAADQQCFVDVVLPLRSLSVLRPQGELVRKRRIQNSSRNPPEAPFFPD